MHRISVIGVDVADRKKLEDLGLSVRAAKGHNSRSWRFETVRSDFGELMLIAKESLKKPPQMGERRHRAICSVSLTPIHCRRGNPTRNGRRHGRLWV